MKAEKKYIIRASFNTKMQLSVGSIGFFICLLFRSASGLGIMLMLFILGIMGSLRTIVKVFKNHFTYYEGLSGSPVNVTFSTIRSIDKDAEWLIINSSVEGGQLSSVRIPLQLFEEEDLEDFTLILQERMQDPKPEFI